MSEREIKELIIYLKDDINRLMPILREKLPIKSELEIYDFCNSVKLSYFEDLVRNNLFPIPYHIDLNPIDGELEKRINLFEKVFLKPNNLSGYLIIKNFEHSIETPLPKLRYYIRFFHKIIQVHLSYGKQVTKIFQQFLNEWNEFISTRKIPVKVIIQLPNIVVRGYDEIIKNKLYILPKMPIKYFSEELFNASRLNSILIYYTKTSGIIFNPDKEKELVDENALKDEKIKFYKEILQIVFTLNINNIYFEFTDYLIDYPWWFFFEFDQYKKLSRRSFRRDISITSKDIQKIFKIYDDLIKSQLFIDDQFIILRNHCLELNNRVLSSDVIMDTFILFEFLFGPRHTSEDIIFNVAFNAGLFLGNTKEKFLDIFFFFKKSYHIRSGLAHGDRWDERLTDIINKNPEFDNHFQLFEKWRYYLSKSLQKLIHLKIKYPKILNDINQLDEKTNRIKKAKYLNYLGEYYKDNSNYSSSLRMLMDALEVLKEIEDKKQRILIKKCILDIFTIKPNVKIYSDELQKVFEELKLRKEFIKENETKIQTIINQLESLYKKKRKLENNPKIAIKGDVIMDLYGIPQSEQVGAILNLLHYKVQSKEIDNDKESLIAELKSNEEFYRINSSNSN